MLQATEIRDRVGATSAARPSPSVKSNSMFAIAFDLDTATLEATYPGPSWNNAYGEIEKVLGIRGFRKQQGSVYFGNEKVTSVTTMLAVQDLSHKFDWFKDSVRDIRMLRIAEDDDLSLVL